MRRVWHVARSDREYVESGIVGREVAGGTMVVEDVADDSEVERASGAVVFASDSLGVPSADAR